MEEIDFGVVEGSDMWERKVALQNVAEHFWAVWYREYLSGLREQSCKSLGGGAAVVKVRDVVVIEEDEVPRHRWRLGIVVELIKSNDWLVRGA